MTHVPQHHLDCRQRDPDPPPRGPLGPALRRGRRLSLEPDPRSTGTDITKDDPCPSAPPRLPSTRPRPATPGPPRPVPPTGQAAESGARPPEHRYRHHEG